MKTRRKLTEETAKRYCTAGKKKKGKIIDVSDKFEIAVIKISASTCA